MKKIIFALLLILLVPLALAHETDEPHEEEACGIEPPAPGERGCGFPTTDGPMTIREWAITKFRPGYEADTAGYWTGGILSLLVLAIAGWRWTRIKPKQRKAIFWLKALGGVAGAIAITFIAYSTYVYWYEDISVSGLEICDEEGCRISMHWHATLTEMNVCGEIVERPWETGDLAGPHTHKDNRIHMHTILEIDPETKEIINTDPMTLGGFFDSIGWQYNKTCFKDTCSCNGEPAETKVWVNNEQIDNIREFSWEDGDEVMIKFE